MPLVWCTLIVSFDSIVCVRLLCEPDECCVELERGALCCTYLVAAWQGRVAAPLLCLVNPGALFSHAFCASFDCDRRLRQLFLAVMAPQPDKYVDKAVNLVRCSPRI